MATNRGKQFEDVVREAFLKVQDTSVVRLPDPTNGYLGIRNISDFIIYHYPYQYFIECKSVHGNTLPFSNITENQWNGMFEKSKIKGIIAGVMCWFVDKDETVFYLIQTLVELKEQGKKSVKYSDGLNSAIECYAITGVKKRVFFDYDMNIFFKEVARCQN